MCMHVCVYEESRETDAYQEKRKVLSLSLVYIVFDSLDFVKKQGCIIFFLDYKGSTKA